MPGGKGVNVARALKALGQPVIATGFAGGATGTRIIEQLTDEAILCDFVRIKEESRTSTALIDPTSGVQTEVNEPGPKVSEAEMSLFCEKLVYLAKGADICVFAGSHPRGVDDKIYAELIGELKRLGLTTVIDTEGEPMNLALRAGPDLVSPNAGEAEELVGHEFRDEQDQIFALYSLCELGPREAILTHEEGCFALVGREQERRLYDVRTERLEPVSAIGAGDAFLAGYLSARYTGRPHAEALRFAVACGAESVLHLGAGVLDPRAAERLEEEVELVELEEPAPLDART
jgi:1-phosphofructokinase/tagatose 6-phosphate kinase